MRPETLTPEDGAVCAVRRDNESDGFNPSLFNKTHYTAVLRHQEKSRVWAGCPNKMQAKQFYTTMAKVLVRLKLAPAGGTSRSGYFTTP
jgi:hypothetical protein